MFKAASSADVRAQSVATNYTVSNAQCIPPLATAASSSGYGSYDIGSSAPTSSRQEEVILYAEKKFLELQTEWNEKLSKASEKVQVSTKEAKKALFDLESEREKTARLHGEIEELRLEVDTLKMTASSREKYLNKELEEFKSKLRKKDNELAKIRESTSTDLSDLGEKCRKLVANLDEKQHLLTQTNDQLKASRDEKNLIESQLEAEKRNREHAEKLGSSMEARNEEFLQREKKLEDKIQKLEEECNGFRAECDRKQKENSELEEAVILAKRAGAEVAVSSGERDRALSRALDENSKLKSLIDEQTYKIAKYQNSVQDIKQELVEKDNQLRDMTREVETQRDYCRSMKIDLARAQEQREIAFMEHENLSRQLIEFRALPICQKHLPTVSSNDFNSLKNVIPFVRDKLEHYDRVNQDLQNSKNEVSSLHDQKRDLLRTCKDKDAMVNECRSSLEQAMAEIERLRDAIVEADRKQEAATMRAARLTEQLQREQGDHEKTLQLLKTTEGEVDSSEQRFQKILHRMLQTLISQRSGQQNVPQNLKLSQLVPMLQKEMAALHAATARATEKSNTLHSELVSATNLANSRENELKQLKIESESRISEKQQQLELERSSNQSKIESLEAKVRSETTVLETKLTDVLRDRDELRSQMIRLDSSKLEMETKLSKAVVSVDQYRSENRLLTAAAGVLLSALTNTLRRLSALIMATSILRSQVGSAEVFQSQLQNLLNSLASTTGCHMEKSPFSPTKGVRGIFAFRKAVIVVLAANRFAALSRCRQKTMVVLPAGSCRQIGHTVGLDMSVTHDAHFKDARNFLYWLSNEDFSKRFLALGSLLSLIPDNSQPPDNDRINSALRSSLRCILTSAVECFDPLLCPSLNRPHAHIKKSSLMAQLGDGLRHAFTVQRSRNRRADDGDGNVDVPIYSSQIIFDSICAYWQKLTDQLVAGWQNQRARLQSELTDAQRQLAIYRPDVETMKKQLENSVSKTELETACSELASTLDREQTLQLAISNQTKQIRRLTEENQAFAGQHGTNIATITSKNAELASYEARLTELVEANDRMQNVATEAEQLLTRSASDRRWACDYVKQVETLAVRWAGKLSRLYTDPVEFRQFYGQLHGLGATMPSKKQISGELAHKHSFHASQACVRLTRTFLHLFDHARKFAQSMADCQHELADSNGDSPIMVIDELSTVISSALPSFASVTNSKQRNPREKQRSRGVSPRKSFGSSSRDACNVSNFN